MRDNEIGQRSLLDIVILATGQKWVNSRNNRRQKRVFQLISNLYTFYSKR